MAGVKKQDDTESSRSKLRAEAEKKVARSADKSAPLKKQVLDKLVHELRVHQVELEMQNEELRGAQEQIAKSRNDYADLYDFSPVGYLSFDGDALIKRVNLTGAALLGVERQKLLKSRFRQFVAPVDVELWDRHFVSVLQQGEKQSCDLRLRRKDGSTLHARLDSIRVEMDDGTFVVRTGMSDITERKQAEDALKESEEINRRLADYYKRLNDISITFGKAVDTADLFSKIAESFRLLTGANASSFSVYDQEARTLRPMSLSIDPLSRDNVISALGTDLFKIQIPVSTDEIEQMLTQGIRRPRDLHELSSGQLPRDVSDSVMDAIECRQIVALAISHDGEIMGTCVAYLRGDQPVVPDEALKTYISLSGLAIRRKQAEEKWQAALAYNRSLIEASLDPLVTINAEGHITDVNLATEKVTGCLRGEIIGTDFSDYFTEPGKARAGYQQVLTAGFVRDYPLDIRHRDGQITRVLYNATLYRDEQGQVLGIFAAARDVTERKRNENLILLQTSVLKILASDIPATQTADKVVEVIKQLTGYDAVGLRLQVGSDYPFVASLGYSADFLKAENTLLNRYPDGGLCRNADGTIDLECTCGMIISGKTDAGNPLFTAGGSAWTNNSLPFLDAPPDTDTRLHPRNRCIHVGFLSLALIPIRAGAERMGLLHLADRKQDQFTPEAIRFYEGIGASIGVALAHKRSETALQKEHIMLARTEGIAHIGSWEWDIATDTVTWSDELFQIFQRDPQEGAPSFAEHPAFYHPEDFAVLRQAVEAAVADGTPYALEIRAIRKDGKTRECMARGVAEMASGGRAVRLFGSLQDITERKRGEEMLRESDAQYRLLSEHMTDTVWLMDMNVKLTYFSPSVEKLRGFTSRELIEMPIEKHVTPNSFKLITEVILQEIPKVEADVNYNPVLTLDLEYTCKDGATVWTENKFSVIRDENGKAISILGEARNITERKQADEELQQSERKFKNIVEHITDIFFMQDSNRELRYISPRAEQVLGYTVEEVRNNWRSYMTDNPVNLAGYEKTTKAYTTGEKQEAYQQEFMHRDGTKRLFEINESPLKNPEGEVIGIVGAIRDITERKKSEEKLQKSYESLKKTLNDAINTMVKIVELRDPYTAGHQQKVADLATAIAGEMKFDDTQIDQLRTAAVIHDIGKIYVPSDILSKPGKLTAIELSLIRTHAQNGYDIVQGMDFPGAVAETILQHHERLDGSGYPNGLKAEDTLMKAKILAVADVVEAMASHRPYRAALGIDKALAEISNGRGKLYDPDVVDTCLELFKEKNFIFENSLRRSG